MSGVAGGIGGVREQLVQARRQCQASLLPGIADGVAELGRAGHRCCLVDYHSFRPAFYVRVLGFDSPRVRAELEFPIEPRLKAVQWLPLSHLADYEEAADPARLRHIYEGMAEFVHHRVAPLALEVPARGPSSATPPAPGHSSAPRLARPRLRHPALRRVLLAAGVWWGVAGVLLGYGLFVFLVL